MKTHALLLADREPATQLQNVGKVLDFFGVPWRAATRRDFTRSSSLWSEGQGRCCLFCDANAFADLLADLETRVDGRQLWRQRVHSAFVFATENALPLQKLVRDLTGDEQAVLITTGAGDGNLAVSADCQEVSGAMAGVQITLFERNLDTIQVVQVTAPGAATVISQNGRAAFLKTGFEGATVFICTGREVIDLDAGLPTGLFDVRDHALSAVPIVMYLRWAFPDRAWRAPEANACLIIDDPLLKPTYGFVDFQELSELMRRHHFSTNVAFIPWNWRRSSPSVIPLFRSQAGGFSLSIHGCDHTRAEFGSRDRNWIDHKTRQAVERMARHEARTGIKHDPVMVFPQGVFSETAMSVLKTSGLIAAANNDTLSADPQPRSIKVSEVWDAAVMGYGNFPLFTRRYPWDGCENFAFDLLLGKPCLVVIHHDYCRDRGERLVELVQCLNALSCSLNWRGLAEVVRRACRQRELSPDVIEVEMYGTELRLENPSALPKRLVIRRRESLPATVRSISADDAALPWQYGDGWLRFECELSPGKSKLILVRFHDHRGNGRPSEGLRHRLKTGLRRYLSEARDNYVVRYTPRFLSRFIRLN